MTSPYGRIVREPTPPSEPLPGQVPNNAGGNWWEVGPWQMLDRFLILGTEGGTYYVSERKLTKDAAKAVGACIDEDPGRVVARTVEISESGRASKNDPAIFVLALVASHDKYSVRAWAYPAVPRVCRTGTHLFTFVDFCQALGRGWGRGLRHTITAWYNRKTSDALAYQLIKYRQRGGWTHRDLLRLAHVKPADGVKETLFAWAVGKPIKPDLLPPIIGAFEVLQNTTQADRAPEVIRAYKLPWEAVPTTLHNDVGVWEALLEDMPYIATIRNLARVTANGTLRPLTTLLDRVVHRIANPEEVRKSRVHPIQVLSALLVYSRGYGERGSLTWTPIPTIISALNVAFYASFANVVPAGKRIMLCLDISGSMSSGSIAGVPGLTPRMGTAAMAMVTARTEPFWAIGGFNTQFKMLNITPDQRLDDVVAYLERQPMGGTDAATPIIFAREHKLNVEAFVMYTDSEHWAGRSHPAEELRRYRKETGLQTKLITVSMVANTGSIADPKDGGMLDVVGFDTETPAMISDFIRG